MSEPLIIAKEDYSAVVMPGGSAVFQLDGVNIGAAKDKQPRGKREWTRRSAPWVPWGKNNNFPEEVMADLRKSTIGKRILAERAKRHVGAGVYYYRVEIDDKGKKLKIPLYLPEIEDFLDLNNVFQVQKAIAEDLETFFNAMPYMRLNLKNEFVASYGHKKMYHCRFGEMAKNTNRIDNVYHSYNWPNPSTSKDDPDYVEIPVYNEVNPLKYPRFVKPLRYSTSDETIFYELAIWDSIRQNGWMAIDRLVPKLKQHIFLNQAILKYHIKIPYDYWHRKYGSKVWEGMNKNQRNSAIQEELANMDTFLKGAENSGKSFVSFYGHDPVTSKPYPGFEINAIENKLKSDDYLPDATAAYSAICFAMGFDPTLIGAGLIDKRNSGGSGSDKRESLANLLGSMPIDRSVSLEPLRLITRINKWNEKFASDLKGSLIHWAYIDSDTSYTMDEKKPKQGEEGQPKVPNETVNS